MFFLKEALEKYFSLKIVTKTNGLDLDICSFEYTSPSFVPAYFNPAGLGVKTLQAHC